MLKFFLKKKIKRIIHTEKITAKIVPKSVKMPFVMKKSYTFAQN